jgi:hypothetical protein
MVTGIVNGCCCCEVVNKLPWLNRLPPEKERTLAAGLDAAASPECCEARPGSSCGGRTMSR